MKQIIKIHVEVELNEGQLKAMQGLNGDEILEAAEESKRHIVSEFIDELGENTEIKNLEVYLE